MNQATVRKAAFTAGMMFSAVCSASLTELITGTYHSLDGQREMTISAAPDGSTFTLDAWGVRYRQTPCSAPGLQYCIAFAPVIVLVPEQLEVGTGISDGDISLTVSGFNTVQTLGDLKCSKVFTIQTASRGFAENIGTWEWRSVIFWSGAEGLLAFANAPDGTGLLLREGVCNP